MRSNIEARARAICEADVARLPHDSASADAAYIERVWQVVAALLEAGLIDDNGTVIPHDHETALAAIHDWRERHPR